MNNRSMLFLALFIVAVFLAVWLDVPAKIKIAFTNLLYGEEMRSFKGFRVAVDPLIPNMEAAGLTREEILAAVSARIQKAGIRSLEEEEWQKTPGQPTLNLTVNAATAGDNSFEYTVLLMVEKNVDPHKGTYKTGIEQKLKTVWITTGVGKGGVADIRATIDEVLDLFLTAHSGG